MRAPPRVRRNWRGLLWQGLAVLLVVAAFGWGAHNVTVALARRNIDIDFGFLARPAGFDIPFKLAEWETGDSYARALWVAGLNTALASAIAILIATSFGLLLALMRRSVNPMARWVARGVIELMRNTPQLLQIVFWYFAVLQALPGPRASLSAFNFSLNVRGLFIPAPTAAWFGWVVLGAVVVAVTGARLTPRAAAACWAAGAVLLIGALGFTGWSVPAMRGFNFAGGWRLPPELLALCLGIGIYVSAFVAENIRASIDVIGPGQFEAARSLGLSPGRTMRLVILPQALRTLLPPLTSQYLNVIKSTTLGAAIAYPEILQIFARTVLNQSGRAVEVMSIVLGIYLAVSLVVASVMNGWDRRLRREGR